MFTEQMQRLLILLKLMGGGGHYLSAEESHRVTSNFKVKNAKIGHKPDGIIWYTPVYIIIY